MKNLFTITALVAATHFLFQSSNAQWTQTSGPEGGYPESFTTIGTTIYAASFIGGVFKSTDMGDHWVWSGNGIPVGTDSRSIATDGSILYVGTTNGVYKSVDGGATWSASSTGITNTNLKAVFVSGSWVYGGIQGSGVFRSSNQGANWEIDTVGLDPSGLTVRSFASVGSSLFVGTAGGVFKSTNDGATWSPANSGLTNTDINTLAVFNGTLLAGTGFNGVFRSTDSGASWNGGQNAITLGLAVIGSDIFEATLGGVMRSTDGGATWSSANTGIPPTNNCRSLGVVGTTLFVGMGNNGDRGGVYRSSDLGGSWVERNIGYINTLVYTLIKTTAGLYAGCADGSLYRSTNSGTAWSFLKNFGTGLTAHYLGATYMYVGTGASGGSVHRSTDNGDTWTFVGTGLPASGTIRGIVETGGFTIAASSSGGIYRSTNGGTNWAVSNSGLTSLVVNALTTFGIYTYVGANGGFFISSNSGANWAISNSGLTTLNVQSIFSPSPSLIYIGTLGGGVFKSTDNGATWAPANNGLTGTQVKALSGVGSNIIAGTTLGVFVSTNAAASWTPSSIGLNNTTIQCLNLDSHGDVTVGTLGNGVWRRPYSELTTVREVHEGIPASFALEQNYPNPFNPTTNIRFRIANYGLVTLKVYDVLGREVTTLVNEKLNAGTYETTFSATGLASGIYFYTLQTGSSIQTRKLILMK